MLGEEVVAEGVVTAPAPEGFHLEDPEGDGREATSDAVLVSSGSVPDVRARVRVTGRVAEPVPGGEETVNLPVTTLEASSVEVLEEGGELPDPVVLGSEGRVPPEVELIGEDELPVDLREPDAARDVPLEPAAEGLDFWESLEGMRVTVEAPVAVSPTRDFDDDVEVWALVEDGAHVTPDDALTDRGVLLLQPHPENRGDQNPERVRLSFEDGLYPASPPELAVGDGLGDVTGVVGYSFGSFEVRATAAGGVEPGGLEPGSSSLEGTADRVTVGVYNVENLNPLPATADRRARLGAQIAGRLGGPDVVALQEIQDGNGTRGGADDPETDATATLEALADAVAAAGGPAYDFVDVAPEPNSSGGVPGGNIRNAFLWNPARVERVSHRSLDSEALAAAGAPEPDAFEDGRDPLVATFELDGRRLTVVNVHFSSRAGSTPIFGAVQPFRQEGEAEREAQSRAVHAWVEARLGEDPDARVAVVGDFNTFEFTDDLTEMLPGEGDGAVLENLQRSVPAGDRHTYVFEGNAQALDHFFVTGSLRGGAELDVVHLNAEFPPADGPDGITSASDHEPLLGRLLLEN